MLKQNRHSEIIPSTCFYENKEVKDETNGVILTVGGQATDKIGTVSELWLKSRLSAM